MDTFKNNNFIDELSLFGAIMIPKFENNHIEDTLYNIGLIVNENKVLRERLINFGLSFRFFLGHEGSRRRHEATQRTDY